jgi:hypothetical protein
MAKKPNPKDETTKEVVKKTDETAVVAAGLEADEGAGFENQTGEDIIMPVVYLLQALSPAVVNNEPEGAKPGRFFNGVTEELMDEFLFVPACTTHEYVEYIPVDEGGGFVRTHPLNSPVVKKCKAEQPFGKYRVPREDGSGQNELIEFFSVFGVIVDEHDVQSFAVIRFKSTKIKVYKQFNTRMQTCQIPRADGNGRFTPAINSHVIHVSSVAETKDNFKFFNLRLRSPVENNMKKSLIGPDDPRYQAAAEVRALVNAGRVQAEYEDNAGVSNDADDDTPF